MITVESAETSLRVTIPTDEVPPERVSAFVDWLRLEALSLRGRLTEAQAGQMAEAAKAAWWSANKARFRERGEHSPDDVDAGVSPLPGRGREGHAVCCTDAASGRSLVDR